VVIKSLKPIMPVESVVIIYVIDLQYISVTKVVDVNCWCYSYRVQNGGSGTLFLLFLHLSPGALFLLNLFLELK